MTAAPLILVTNRAPVSFSHTGQRLRLDRGAGGVVTALRHLSRARALTWIAAATGVDDHAVAVRQRERGGLIGSGRFTVRLLRLPEDLFADFYGEFSNRVLWFVQHGLWSRRTEPESAERLRELGRRYLEASAAFADGVAIELHRPGRVPAVMTQDYQLYAVPRLVRERVAGAAISHFTHIPWPAPDVWRAALPDDVTAALIDGMLGADVLGFQDPTSLDNFAASVETFLGEDGVIVGDGSVQWGSARTALRVRPVSIDVGDLSPNQTHLRSVRADGRRLIVRVDRIDPIKNVPLGFDALERVLERRPEWIGKLRFLARLVPSRSMLPEYDAEWKRSLAAAERVNARFGSGTIEVVRRSDRGRALAELAAADVVLVNSVADGMNLVAKEAAALNPRGVIVLSRQAGAFAELEHGAVGIDPSSVEDTARGLEQALDMEEGERIRRAELMREGVRGWTSRQWSEAQLADLEEAVRQRGLGSVGLRAS